MNPNPLLDDYLKAKEAHRVATMERAADFDRLMQLARACIAAQLEQMHGAKLRKAEQDMDAAWRRYREERNLVAIDA